MLKNENKTQCRTVTSKDDRSGENGIDLK